MALDERLYLQVPGEFAPAFEQFGLADSYAPGSYELTVGAAGDDFVLKTSQGVLVQSGAFGVPIAENMGFKWAPARGSFAPGSVVPFQVLSPRDASRDLSARLVTRMDRAGNFLSLQLSGTDNEQIASILNAVMARHVVVAADLKSRKLDETLLILEDQLVVMQSELERAEQELEEFRITTINLPSDQPINAGLELTRDPVFGNYFNMKIEVEQLRRDRERLQAVTDEFANGDVRIEALEIIPAAAASSELRRILDELVEARSQLRVYRDRYADDYPPIQDLLVQIGTIEEQAVPRVVGGIMDQLMAQERDLEGRVAAAAQELQEIPPRQFDSRRPHPG